MAFYPFPQEIKQKKTAKQIMQEKDKRPFDAIKDARMAAWGWMRLWSTELSQMADGTPHLETIKNALFYDNSEGWIFWMGGECPVLEGSPIEIIYRCGERKVCKAMDSASNDWRIEEKNGRYDYMDIIAYREIGE
jgi:hypothetical protein